MFHHNFLPPIKLKQTNINGKRYYILPDGITKFKSVTTVLSEKTDNTALFKWRKRVGNTEANRISGIATRRGKSIHKVAESFLMNEENIYGLNPMPTTIESFEPIKKTLESHVDNIRGIELPVFSKGLRAAGTADLVAEYDGDLAIIDHKTSKRPKREDWILNYFLQETAYSLMIRAMYGLEVNKIVTIITVDNESEPQIFIKDPRKYISQLLPMFA